MNAKRLMCAILLAAIAVSAGQGQSPWDKLQKAAKKAEKAAGSLAPVGRPNSAAPGAQPGTGTGTGTALAPSVVPREALAAKVHEELMGPRSQSIVMSEDGEHMAIGMPKGSRQVMLIDGVEGPEFDEIPSRVNALNLQVQFSPTGGRSAYMARRGQDYFAVVDGKEAGVVWTTQGLGTFEYSNFNSWRFWFSRDGKRLAYAVVNPTGSFSMVADGVKGPNFPNLDLGQTVLEGHRLAYLAQTPDQKWRVVIDEKQGPLYDSIKSLKMTPDGAHYAYFALRSVTWKTVVDGVEGKPYGSLSDLELAPDGRVAFMATRQGNGTPLLVVGGQEIPNTRTFTLDQGPGGHAGYHVAFSPDGKRFAYVKQNLPSPGFVAVVDGKQGREYKSIDLVQFSPDGSRLFYLASAENLLMFTVIDGQELNGYNRVTNFLFSPDGKLYAFEGWSAQAPGFTLTVDGKEGPRYKGEIMDHSLRFSPDSKHYAFGAPATIATYQPIVDGAPVNENLAYFRTRGNSDPLHPVVFPPLFYSPDGNRLAFSGMHMGGTSKASLFLDGTAYEGQTATFEFPSFSPDSRHFAWIVWSGKAFTLMMDGKVGPGYDDIFETELSACKFLDGRTYRFYGVKGGQVYRVQVDIGS